MSNEEKIKSIVSEHLGIEEAKVVNDAQLAEDLMADSLDMVELDMAMEDEFEIVFEDVDYQRWKTVGDIIKDVENLTNL